MNFFAVGMFAFFYLATSTVGFAETSIEIELEVPKLEEDPYFRPYVAVWLETEKRKPLTTLALWYMVERTEEADEDGKKWLKDLRKWWRRIGRSKTPAYDAVTGATRKPGVYKIQWSEKAIDESLAISGNYFLNFEAAREEGGRTFHRVPVELFNSNGKQTIQLPAEDEFGSITIHVENKK